MADLIDNVDFFVFTPHAEAPDWTNEAFAKIGRNLRRAQQQTLVEPIHVEPSRPYDGVFTFADGTDFNPGRGRGAYYWDSNEGVAGEWRLTGGRAVEEDILNSDSHIDQILVAGNTPLQVTFGAPEINEVASIDAAGAVTFHEADDFIVRVFLAIGREGGGGSNTIFGRLLLNGEQFGESIGTVVDDSNDVNAETIFQIIPAQVGDVLTVEFYSDDSLGAGNGGIFFLDPTLPGWSPAPSAEMHILRVVMKT